MRIKETAIVNGLVLAPYGPILSSAREFKNSRVHWQDGPSTCLLLCAVGLIDTIKMPLLATAAYNGWISPETAAVAYLGSNAAEKLALSYIFRRVVVEE